MRREQRAEQQRGRRRPPERKARDRAEQHRERERQEPERDRAVAVALEQAEVELHAGDEHEVQQAELPEVGDRGAPGVEQAEAVRADEEAAEEQADQAGDACALHERRADDHHEEQHEELPGAAFRLLERDGGEGGHVWSVLSRGCRWRCPGATSRASVAPVGRSCRPRPSRARPIRPPRRSSSPSGARPRSARCSPGAATTDRPGSSCAIATAAGRSNIAASARRVASASRTSARRVDLDRRLIGPDLVGDDVLERRPALHDPAPLLRRLHVGDLVPGPAHDGGRRLGVGRRELQDLLACGRGREEVERDVGAGEVTARDLVERPGAHDELGDAEALTQLLGDGVLQATGRLRRRCPPRTRRSATAR